MTIQNLIGMLTLPLLIGCGSIGHDASLFTCTSGSVFVTERTVGKEIPIHSPSYGGNELAQSFQVTSKTKIGSVSLELMRIGTPGVSTLTVRIQGDSSGQPDGTSLASATLSVASTNILQLSIDQNISTAPAFYVFSFGNNGSITLSSGKTYWLRVQADYTASDTDAIEWIANDTNSYSNGNAAYKDGTGAFVTTLLDAQRDFVFNLAGGC